MKEDKVFFKGILGGLQVYVDPDMDLDIIKDEIKEKLDSSKGFFVGTDVNLVFTGREFKDDEKRDLTKYISQQINLGKIDFCDPAKKGEVKMDEIIHETDESMTRFFKGTVRNGQRIDYHGSIIVMGDVNPGAEIVADGNIIVLGNLRGMAHAGATGNMEAIVIALCLQPTQLRIGNIITRSPEDEIEKPTYPELAYIKGDNLLIEPYTLGKIKY